MRPLVHAEVAAHAVTRAVAVVLMLLPHGIARQHVELCARGALGEHGGGEADVALQHQRVVAPLLVGERA